MTAALTVDLVGKLAWPVVIMVVLVTYRRALLRLFERARVLEGPGELKVRFDPSRVEQIVADGQREDLSAKAVANRIMTEAIVDEREFRILRGLLGEKIRSINGVLQNPLLPPGLGLVVKEGMDRTH